MVNGWKNKCQITIETSRGNTSLEGQEIIIDLVIVYDIMCLSWHK